MYVSICWLSSKPWNVKERFAARWYITPSIDSWPVQYFTSTVTADLPSQLFQPFLIREHESYYIQYTFCYIQYRYCYIQYCTLTLTTCSVACTISVLGMNFATYLIIYTLISSFVGLFSVKPVLVPMDYETEGILALGSPIASDSTL